MKENIRGFSLSLRIAFGGKLGQRFQNIVVGEWMPTEIGKSNGVVSCYSEKSNRSSFKLKSPDVHIENKQPFQYMQTQL